MHCGAVSLICIRVSILDYISLRKICKRKPICNGGSISKESVKLWSKCFKTWRGLWMELEKDKLDLQPMTAIVSVVYNEHGMQTYVKTLRVISFLLN